MFRRRRIGETSEFAATSFLPAHGNVLKRDSVTIPA
jgi:hypothetical protein